MRKSLLLILVLLIFSSFSVSTTSSEPSNEPAPKAAISIEKISSMKMKEAEKILGRKLTLKEKIAFKIAQHKIKKELRAKEKGKPSKGQSAFILSLIGLCILFVPYLSIAALPLAIIGLVQGSKAKKENPNDSKAQTAIILSIITLALFAIALILVIAIIAAWDGWY